MTRNVTIRLDEAIAKKCRFAAVEEDKSLSRWISDVLVKTVSDRDRVSEARERAIKRLETGFSLGRVPLSREDVYAE